MFDIFINKNKWNKFSESEMENYQTSVFDYYRKRGFPYFPTTIDWRRREYEKLIKYDYTKCIDTKNKVIRQTMHGLSLCWSYFPHHYEIQCNDMKTAKQAFDNDETFRNVIKKRIKMGDNISDNGIRKMLKIYSGVQCVSNFRPTAASAIYHHFRNGNVIYDMSAGFGGRLIGSSSIKDQMYYGVDPSTKTYQGLLNMINDFNLNAHVMQQGSEIHSGLEEESVDLCFTSPPYFNCEKYSDEGTQSYKKYPDKNSWMNIFVRNTIENCISILKKDGKIILNIQNVKSYPQLVEDTIRMFQSLDLKLEDTWKLQLSSIGGGYKYEPILIFKK